MLAADSCAVTILMMRDV